MALREQTMNGIAVRRGRSRVPTTTPHPVPGGEYDRDGFLYKCPVENFKHRQLGVYLQALLEPYMARRHGDRAVVTGDVGMYARRGDRHARPMAADLLVSLTAGAVGAAGTPPNGERKSYKLWQEPVPDLVLEIVSPSSAVHDTVEKPRRYEALGIRECWVFDADRLRLPGGLVGRVQEDGLYRDARPRPQAPGEVPLPPGAAGYWSDVLGLYLYVDGTDLHLHAPATGRLRDLGEEADRADREAERANRETAARETAEADRDAAQAHAMREADRANREVAARKAADARIAALEAQLRDLRDDS